MSDLGLLTMLAVRLRSRGTAAVIVETVVGSAKANESVHGACAMPHALWYAVDASASKASAGPCCSLASASPRASPP